MEYPIRINKYLAKQNTCSRREADRFISEGKIALNGRVAVLGDQVHEGDKVEIIRDLKKDNVYLAFNKPEGIVTHSPQEGEKSIEDILKYAKKVFPVGRLDKDSWGLILLTNDGRVTGKLLSPESENEKEYLVEVHKSISGDFLRQMSNGVKLDDGYVTKKCQIRRVENDVFSIILTEGKKRQIRRMCDALGYRVTALKRVRICNIRLGDLQPGSFRKIQGAERQEFLEKLGLHV